MFIDYDCLANRYQNSFLHLCGWFLFSIVLFFVTSNCCYAIEKAVCMAVADAGITEQFGAVMTNHGRDSTVAVSQVNSYGGNSNALMRFDLSAIPVDADIQNVTLCLCRAGNATDGDLNTGATVRFAQVPIEAIWDEYDVNWHSVPPLGGEVFAVSFGPDTLGTVVCYESPQLLDWVRRAVADPALAWAGWRLFCVSNGNQGVSLATREYDFVFKRPRLEITYQNGTAVMTEEPACPSCANLTLAELTTLQTGNPFIGEMQGLIGLAVSAGQSLELLAPRPITGDFTFICHADYSFSKYWTFAVLNEAGIFLRPPAPEGELIGRPAIAAFTITSWSGNNMHIPTGRAPAEQTLPAQGLVNRTADAAHMPAPSENRREAATLVNRNRLVHEIYYRIQRRGDAITTAYSTTGYEWITLTAGTSPADYDQCYPGFYVYCPEGTSSVQVTIRALQLLP